MTTEQPYLQQVHATDNGAIVLIARSAHDWMLCCKACRETWELEAPGMFAGSLPGEIRPAPSAMLGEVAL